MNITKKIISKNLSSELRMSIIDSGIFVNKMIELIKIKSKTGDVKIHNFGTFTFKTCPERIGRNPKTRKTFIIKSFKKLTFKPSIRLKFFLN